MTIRYYDKGRKSGEEALDIVGATAWLRGEERRISEPRDTDGKRYISADEAAEITRGELSVFASKLRRFFEQGMPPTYALPESSTEVGVIEALPHLGWCNFAAVKLRKSNGAPYLVRFLYANFNAQIDTTPGGRFFKIDSPRRSTMYFGLAYSPDGKMPNSVTLDRSIHHSGVSFITNDPHKALNNAVMLRTGMSLDGWNKLAADKIRSAHSAA